jgi:hypothetical protein
LDNLKFLIQNISQVGVQLGELYMEKLERFGNLDHFINQSTHQCFGHGSGELEPQLIQGEESLRF